MISVLIQCHNQETELVRTLGALVPGAVEGIISDVTILDDGSEDGTRKVADTAGCNLYDSQELSNVIGKMRGEWVLMIEPGAKPLNGWIEGLGEHISNGDMPARFSPSRNYRHPFYKRIFSKSSALEYGVLARRRDVASRASVATNLSEIAKGLSTIKLNCELVTAGYARDIN